MPNMMPKEQSEKIAEIERFVLDATNMTKEEAYNFAFRCWQLNFVREKELELICKQLKNQTKTIKKQAEKLAYYEEQATSPPGTKYLDRALVSKSLYQCNGTGCTGSCPLYHYALADPILSGMSCVRIAGAFIRQLVEETEKLKAEKEELKDVAYRRECEVFTAKADTVRKMQSMIKERCINGGIYPAFVASTIDQIAKEMLEGEL